MPEIRTEGPLGAEGKPEKASSWGGYVDALVDRLKMVTPPEVLDGRMEFDLPTWLAQVRFSEGVVPVHLDIRTRKGGVRLRSDRALPDAFDEHTPLARHLEVFALTEAKIRFLQRHFPDSPALRGFDATLAVGRLRREARFIVKNGYWSHGYHEGRRKFVAIGATALVLAACGLLPPSEAPTSPSSPTNPNTALATSTATKKDPTPTPVPTEVKFEQQGQGSYGPPAPEEAVILTNAGGENIRSILVDNIQDGDTVLTAYEEAVLIWAEKQGRARSSVQVEFLYNGGTGDNFRWQFYLRDITTGNVLWTTDDQGAFQTYPVALSVDKIHGLYVEDTYKLQEISNTADADVRFTKDNFVKVLAGEPVTMGDQLYYSQWFNTLTGQFEAIPGVEESVVELPVIAESAQFVSERWSYNMEIDQEKAKGFYSRFLDALAQNEANTKYFENLLGQAPTGELVLAYLRSHDYVLPYKPEWGQDNFKLPVGKEVVRFYAYERDVRLDGLRFLVYDIKMWNEDTALKNYLEKELGGLPLVLSIGKICVMGPQIDSQGRLVFVVGTQNPENRDFSTFVPEAFASMVGGRDGEFNLDRDPRLVNAYLAQINYTIRKYDSRVSWATDFPFTVATGVYTIKDLTPDDLVLKAITGK